MSTINVNAYHQLLGYKYMYVWLNVSETDSKYISETNYTSYVYMYMMYDIDACRVTVCLTIVNYYRLNILNI